MVGSSVVVIRSFDYGYSRLLAEPFESFMPRMKLPPDCQRSRIPVGKAHELLRTAIATTGDSAIGLKVGQTASMGDGGALDYAIHSAETVEQALLTLPRFIRLLNGELVIQLEVVQGRACLRLTSRALGPAVAEDFLMSALYTVHIRRLFPSVTGLECWFTQSQPRSLTEHTLVFQDARLRFGAPYRGFLFDRSWLSTAVATADRRLHMILTQQLERDLQELPEADSYTERIQKLMTNETPITTCTLPLAAKAMKMSSRTLARRLKSEDTSFADVLDRVRKARAIQYLSEKEMPIEEIALALGFSRSSAFHRAFKRWIGKTPGDYRKAGERSSLGSVG